MTDTVNQLYSDFAAYFAAIDLSELTPPQIVEQLAYDDVFSTLMRDFVARDPAYTILLESDPAIKVLEAVAYREHLTRQSFNDRAQQLLLAFATGGNLEHLGAFYGVYREIITPQDNTVYPPVEAVYESDEDLRKRIQLAPEAFTTAGSAGAYLYHTYSGSPGVANAVVYNNASGLVDVGTVLVLLLVRDGYDPDQAVNEVRTRLFRDDVKPLTDQILIRVSTPANFGVNATLYVNGGPDASTIRNQARDRLYAYLALRKKVGMLVSLSGIYSALNGDYVERVSLTSPTEDFEPGLQKYANLASLNINVVRVGPYS